MPFDKGHKLATGRPKGSINRTTEQAKLAISRIANEGIDILREDLQRIRKSDPLEAAKIYIRLLEFIVPKKSSVDIKGEIDQRIHQISVNINKSGSDAPND